MKASQPNNITNGTAVVSLAMISVVSEVGHCSILADGTSVCECLKY